MQKYQEKPIPLILRDENEKYRVNQEALDYFSSIDGKLAIISVAGIYRTGKSFLLNTILLNIKNGFAVGPTVNPKTKGIWVWGKPLIFKNQQDEMINVLVLDSEGLGSTQEDVNHDLRLFSITLLLSSAFMYNTVGAIDQNAIDRLGLVLRLCQHLKSDNFNDFPDFYWILRDFSLALVDKNNVPLTTKCYLQNCLSNQPGDSQYRNKIRQSIKQAFQNRNCYTFVRPLMNQQSLQSLDKMQLEQLRPQFVEQIINFRKLIFSNLRVKSIKGRQIKGNMLCQLINIYVQCINSDKLPVIQSGWQQLCLKQLHQVLYDIQQAVSKRVRNMKQHLPRTKKQLIKQQQLLIQQFQQIFQKRLKNNHKAKQYFKSVQEIISKELKGIQQNMKIKNSTETQNFVRKQFQSIEKRLKQSEFKNMGQLVKQFQIFYEYYRKKCPYKDQIQTGLQLLMKKFSDSSLILFKNTHLKKDAEIQQLRQQIQKIISQLNIKQQKLKQQKNSYQDKAVKLQTNLEDLKKQNDQMSILIEELQGKLQIAENMNNNSMEEQLSHENIMLKKKVMDLQDKQRELMCQYSQQINGLKQQILLKTNSAQHAQKTKLELNTKLQQLQLQYKNCKEVNEQKIHELIIQLQQIAQQSNNLQKSLKIKITQQTQCIDELQRTLQLKNNQITQIYNRNSQQSSMLSQMILQQQRKCLQQKQKQIFQLRQSLTSSTNILQNRIKIIQTQLSQKQTQFKISKLSIEQQKALLLQKIQFIKKQSNQKIQKNINLQQEINNYVQMIQQKDNTIQQLTLQIQELKNYQQMQNQEIQQKIIQMAEQIQIKNNYIKNLQKDIQTNTLNLNKKLDDKNFKLQQMKILLQKSQQEIKNTQKQINQLKKLKQENDRNMQQHIQNIKYQNKRYFEDHKRNAQLSLVQLKNFYQMEKERLQKRLLQQRKKYQYNQSNTVTELKNKYTKQIRALNQQNNQLNAKLQDLQEQSTKSHNQYEIKIMGLEQDLQNERKTNQNKFQILKRKYQEAMQDLEKAQKQHDQDRISFVKKIEGLNFEISKKQKQILQLNVKKQSLQTNINKKDTQLDNIKKTMHQEIQSSLKKVSETQAKYQKINQQYSRYKIEAQKQNALLNQRNQFLNAKLIDLHKEKQSGSLKNLEKADKNKIAQLKQQLQRQKTQNISLQAKMQNLRKAQKQSSNQYKKQINQLQKQNVFMKQKIQLNDSKINELEIKIVQKTQMFKKQVDEMRARYNTQRIRLQNDLDSLRQKLNQSQDQKKQTIFKLQMQLALSSDKISNVQLQRDQNKKQLQQTEKRLQSALNQIKKQNQKDINASQVKKSSVDKRYSNQLQLMKMSSKVRQQQLQQGNKKLKQEIKILKQRNFQLQQKLSRAEKTIGQDKNLMQQLQRIKRQKQQMIMCHRNQLQKQIDDWKRKNSQLQKKNRQIEKQNSSFAFILQKQKAKSNSQKQQMTQKIKQLEDQLNWQRKKLAQPKNRVQSSKSKKFSMTASDVMGSWH